ncbi:MAG: hypothetical protein AAGD06_26370, partial [Acidobacteriota bacterium]
MLSMPKFPRPQISATHGPAFAAGVLMACALVLGIPAAPVLGFTFQVDDLLVDQGPITQGTDSSVSGGGIIGGERDLSVTRSSGTGDVEAEVVAATARLGFAVAMDTEGEAVVTWDGADGSAALDPSGLPGVDLTEGGNVDALFFSVVSSTAGVTMRLEVFTDGADASTFETTLPAIVDPRVYRLPFAGFVAASTSVGGADFSNVGAVRLTLSGGSGATAVLQGPIEGSGTAPVVTVGKVDLDDFSTSGGSELGSTEVQAGDTITYQITVDNTGGEATMVDLQDLLDANLAQVGGAADVRISPIAFEDRYDDHCGNTRLEIRGSSALLANDFDPNPG